MLRDTLGKVSAGILYLSTPGTAGQCCRHGLHYRDTGKGISGGDHCRDTLHTQDALGGNARNPLRHTLQSSQEYRKACEERARRMLLQYLAAPYRSEKTVYPTRPILAGRWTWSQ